MVVDILYKWIVILIWYCVVIMVLCNNVIEVLVIIKEFVVKIDVLVFGFFFL